MSTSSDANGPPFVVVDGDPGSRIVIHVPHASTIVPGRVRQRIELSDEELAQELVLMTDAATDRIAREASDLSEMRPWLFINQRSRLVVDPERFPDPVDEVMAAPDIGMGAVYERTAHGGELREDDAAHRDELITAFFDPYAGALTDFVEGRLEADGQVTIVDLHSYPAAELPYERHVHADAPRPACCIGTDERHTPPELADAVQAVFRGLGETMVNQPFAGTYVPLRFYGTDLRVRSVMVELRRDTYQESPTDVARVAGMLARLCDVLDAGRPSTPGGRD
ncbi:MAG: hypothetical protein QG597_3729 [Actinomycetota bacterium]|jgi:predicted N-formylglutamate amidohydrolase|nr:hypothetical protein [Actinomycetota bacterium]